MRALDKLARRWQLLAMDRVDAGTLGRRSARDAVGQFRRVARRVPAYAEILRVRGIDPDRIRTPADFTRHCPILEKQDLFGRFPIEQLCVGGRLGPLAGVLTSSGQGGHFAFGLTSPRQVDRAARAIELAMEYSFGTDRHPTLLINALPMGVRFGCATVTVAETSVREDMVCALVEQFASRYAQTILVMDPLFCKRVIDEGRARGIDWARWTIHVILGEETFGESFRRYVAERLGQDPEDWSRGLIGSSMGVAELGLNLFFETRETIRLRQAADRNPHLWRAALGDWPGHCPPLLFVYNPLRIFVEVVETDREGYGALTVTTLDPASRLPLIRYRTGDRAKLLDTATLASRLGAAESGAVGIPRLPMLALVGRDTDRLPGGPTLLDFKDSLYAASAVADELTGAFRVEPCEDGYLCHVQIRPGATTAHDSLARHLEAVMPTSGSSPRGRVVAWTYAEFPFGRTFDYERKFRYLA